MPTVRTPARVARSVMVCAVAAAALAGLSVLAPGAPSAAAAGRAWSSRPRPTRLADTRQATCGCAQLDANTIRVQVAGLAGVPVEATSAALTITIGGADRRPATPRPGRRASRCRAPRRSTGRRARPAANGTILALGANGSVDVYVSSPAAVIVDVTGAFAPTTGAVAAGRYNAVAPVRLLDTRANAAPVASGAEVQVPLPPGVPADATVLGGDDHAHRLRRLRLRRRLSVRQRSACLLGGEHRPGRADAGGDGDRAGQRVGLTLYLDGAAHVLVDVYGWFSGPSSPATTSGMFVSNAPLRVWDTRDDYEPVWAGGTMEIYPTTSTAAQLWSQLSQASSLVFNLTVTQPASDGWITVYAARTAQPGTSTINWAKDETVANLAITPWSTTGVAFYGYSETDILVDITGYFTGVPQPGSGPPSVNDSPGYTGEPGRDLARDSCPRTRTPCSMVWTSRPSPTSAARPATPARLRSGSASRP